MSCRPRPAGEVHNRIERTPPDAAIADADKVAVRLQVKAASKYCYHARRGAAFAKAARVRAPYGNRRYRMHCRAISVALAFDGAKMIPASVSLRTWEERT